MNKALRILLFATLPIFTFISTAPTDFAITDIDYLTLVHNQTAKDAIIAKKKVDKELEAADLSAEINKHMYFHKRLLDGISSENLKKLVENEIRTIYLSQSFAMKNKDEELRQLRSKLSQENKHIAYRISEHILDNRGQL